MNSRESESQTGESIGCFSVSSSLPLCWTEQACWHLMAANHGPSSSLLDPLFPSLLSLLFFLQWQNVPSVWLWSSDSSRLQGKFNWSDVRACDCSWPPLPPHHPVELLDVCTPFPWCQLLVRSTSFVKCYHIRISKRGRSKLRREEKLTSSTGKHFLC